MYKMCCKICTTKNKGNICKNMHSIQFYKIGVNLFSNGRVCIGTFFLNAHWTQNVKFTTSGMYRLYDYRRGSRRGGGVKEENFERKCLLIHVSTREHIKLDKHATLSLFLLFKRIVFFFLLCLMCPSFERGGGLQPP